MSEQHVLYVNYASLNEYDGYRAGDDGSIQTCRRRGAGLKMLLDGPWKNLVPGFNRGGYHRIIVYKDGKPHSRTIHQLILEAFIGPKPDGMCCRHLNGIKTDNRLSNLCWGTFKENSEDCLIHGTLKRGENHGMSKLNEQSVREIRQLRNQGMRIAEIARIYGITDVTVSHVCHRKTWTHVE
jgi:hypothetical protein